MRFTCSGPSGQKKANKRSLPGFLGSRLACRRTPPLGGPGNAPMHAPRIRSATPKHDAAGDGRAASVLRPGRHRVSHRPSTSVARRRCLAPRRRASARARSGETELGRSLVQCRCPADKACLGREVVAGVAAGVPGCRVWRCQEGRKTCADESAHLGIGRPAVLLSVTVRLRAVSRMHYLAHMRRVIRSGPHAHARGMGRGHRCHHGDREDGKHGDKTTEHVGKIGGARGNVHCRRRRTSGRRSPLREANGIACGSGIGALGKLLCLAGAGGLSVAGYC